MSATGLPMTPTEYAAAQRGLVLAAEYHEVQRRIEYHEVQRRIDAGHEFAALMEAGGSVFVSGEWRGISSLTDEGSNRLTIACDDGTEWLALRTATRPYRPAGSDRGTEG